MSDLNTHCRTVLASIIPDRKDLLEVSLQHLVPAYFQDQILSNIFILLERYSEITGGVLTKAALRDNLGKHMDAGKLALYDEVFQALIEQESSEADFRWAIQEIRDLAAERATGEVLMQGVEIFRTGSVNEKGLFSKGHLEARTFIIEKFSEIDKDLTRQTSPEGDMRLEGDEMLADYLERKRSHQTGTSPGILFGIESLDTKIGGFQNGDVGLIVGSTSVGKTAACVQLAWSAAVEQGNNVVFLTTETLRPQVRRKLLARHSKHSLFGLPEGLNTRDIKAGTLPESLEARLQDVIRDFTTNPNYGKVYIVQVPRGASISTVEARLYRLQRLFPIHLVIVDYLRLLRAEKRRQSDREELSSIMIEAKQLATTFDDGRGVPIISPWQVSRMQWEIAQKAQFYTTSALSESAEASNTADVIVSLLMAGEVEGRYAELRGQVLKNRDGETAAGLIIDVDYATAYFASKRAHNLNTLMDASPEAEFSGLLT